MAPKPSKQIKAHAIKYCQAKHPNLLNPFFHSRQEGIDVLGSGNAVDTLSRRPKDKKTRAQILFRTKGTYMLTTALNALRDAGDRIHTHVFTLMAAELGHTITNQDIFDFAAAFQVNELEDVRKEGPPDEACRDKGRLRSGLDPSPAHTQAGQHWCGSAWAHC